MADLLKPYPAPDPTDVTAWKFYTTAELADFLRTPVETVRYWRHINYGPASVKVGRRVLYRRNDVDQWLVALMVDAGADPKAVRTKNVTSRPNKGWTLSAERADAALRAIADTRQAG